MAVSEIVSLYSSSTVMDCEILEVRDVANQIYIPNAWHAILIFVK